MLNENNELRCHANEIILMLHKLKEVGQIQLLYMACQLAIKDLDPELWQRMVKDMQPAGK